MSNLKKCLQCNTEKLFEFFGNCKSSKDRLYPRCKICVSKINKKTRTKREEQILKNGYVKIEEKICTKCKNSKPVEQFYKKNASKDGYDIYCKNCEKNNVQNRIKCRLNDLKKSTNNYRAKKTCISCNTEKNNIDFYKSKRSIDGLGTYCKICNKNKHLSKKYKLDIKIFEKMYENQNKSCDICKRLIEKEKICIDHNHSTGQVRGLLCRLCNTSLGALNENVELLGNMINYINFWLNK